MNQTHAKSSAPDGRPSQASPRRTTFLSGVAEATIDIRKACNGIKRMTSLGAASMVMGMDPKQAVAAAEEMAFDVLKSIGFDVSDENRLAAVLPMMMEASALVLADAAYHAEEERLGKDALLQASRLGVAVLSEVAKSRAVAKMVETTYPADMDSVVALRLTAASAMASVAVEIAEFDYAHTPADCIKESSKIVVRAALDAANMLAPGQSSPSARLMLTQSLIQSAAKVYSAAWRVVSQMEAARLDMLSEPALEASLSAMESRPLSELLAPVNQRFNSAFLAIAESAVELIKRDAPVANSAHKAASPRPR
jgi:hypothetical protein